MRHHQSTLSTDRETSGRLTIYYSDHPRGKPQKISLPKHEERNFDFEASEQGGPLISKLREIAPSFSTREFANPRDVATLLNNLNFTTACGERWTPRLAAFLLEYLRRNPPAAIFPEGAEASKPPRVGKTSPLDQISRMTLSDTAANSLKRRLK